MIETLREIVGKLVSMGPIAAGGLMVFEFFRWLFSGLIDMLVTWVTAKIDLFWGLVQQQMAVLGVDLTPGTEFAAIISKANVILPLDEAWHYTLLLLGVYSVLVGVKWARNLIPGLK